MKIFDCFMYFDEEVVLDLRLNSLNEYVDYFVIVESSFNHRGENRELKFNHKKFEKFEKKIIYLVYDKLPQKIETINTVQILKVKNQENIYIMLISGKMVKETILLKV